MDSVLRDAVNTAPVNCEGQDGSDATAGGITAQLYNGSAAVNCYNTGKVQISGSSYYSYAGGIAGWSNAGFYSSNKIYNCTNTGGDKRLGLVERAHRRHSGRAGQDGTVLFGQLRLSLRSPVVGDRRDSRLRKSKSRRPRFGVLWRAAAGRFPARETQRTCANSLKNR